jgi:hypothetical protein
VQRGEPEQFMWEDDMNVQRKLIVSATALVMFGATAAAGGGPAAEPSAPSAVPDFSGIWRHGALPWLVPPASGPGPVTNRSRRQDSGVSDYGQLVGDYTNPILQPWAADVVKKNGQLSLAGLVFPSPSNQCWPEPVPYLFKHMGMTMLQLPQRVVMLFSEDHEVRDVRLNQPHPAQVKPSWHGDAVGHYEGDTLVVDTVGIKVDRPFAMIDLFGTPFSSKLHVVERYQLVDREAAKGVIERGIKENWRPNGPPNPNYDDKYLLLHFLIEDEGTFTTPWTADMIYLRDRLEWPEQACAENPRAMHAEEDVPRADKPDF